MNAVKTRFWRLVTSRATLITLNLAFAVFSARARNRRVELVKS